MNNILEFNSRARPKAQANKKKHRDTYESIYALCEGKEVILNVFKSEIIPLYPAQRKGINILRPKQIFETLPVAFAQVKAAIN